MENMIQEVCSFASYEQQATDRSRPPRETGPQVHQKKAGDTHPCQGEGRGLSNVLGVMRKAAAGSTEPVRLCT